MANVLQLRDRVVDLESGEVWVAEDKVVRLTPIERRLLAYLVAVEPRPASREELLEAVWGYRRDTETRTVYATINRLRSKVEADPDQPVYVVTDRAAYRFLRRPGPAASTALAYSSETEPLCRLAVFASPFSTADAETILEHPVDPATLERWIGPPSMGMDGALFPPLPDGQRQAMFGRLPARTRDHVLRLRGLRIVAQLEAPTAVRSPFDRRVRIAALEADLLQILDGCTDEVVLAKVAIALADLAYDSSRKALGLSVIDRVFSGSQGAIRAQLAWRRSRLLLDTDFAAARRATEEAASLASRLGIERLIAPTARQLAAMDLEAGDVTLAVARLEGLSEVARNEPATLGLMAIATSHLGEIERARRLADRATELAQERGDNRAYTSTIRAAVCCCAGRYEEALGAAQVAVTAAVIDQLPILRGGALLYVTLGAIALERWSDAERAASTALAIAEQTQDLRLRASARLHLACLRMGRGGFEDGRSLLRETLVVQHQLGARWLETCECAAILAAAERLAAGAPAEAIAILEPLAGSGHIHASAVAVALAISRRQAGEREAQPAYPLVRCALVDDLERLLSGPTEARDPVARVVRAALVAAPRR